MFLNPVVFIIFNLFQVFFSDPLVLALLILLQVNKRILALSVLASFSVFTIVVISFLGRKEEREIGIEEENRNHYP